MEMDDRTSFATILMSDWRKLLPFLQYIFQASEAQRPTSLQVASGTPILAKQDTKPSLNKTDKHLENYPILHLPEAVRQNSMDGVVNVPPQ